MATILNIIGGLEKEAGRSFGSKDHLKLALFFRGPDLVDAQERAARAAREFARLAG